MIDNRFVVARSEIVCSAAIEVHRRSLVGANVFLQCCAAPQDRGVVIFQSKRKITLAVTLVPR